MHTTLDLPDVFEATLSNLDRLASLDDPTPGAVAEGLGLAAKSFSQCATALARLGDTEGAALFRAHGALLDQLASTGGTMADLTNAATVARGFARERAPSFFMKVH